MPAAAGSHPKLVIPNGTPKTIAPVNGLCERILVNFGDMMLIFTMRLPI
jgi:hypothetical protein